MRFKVGDRIIWTTRLDSTSDIRDGYLTRVAGDWLNVDGRNSLQDSLNRAYAFPYEARAELLEVLEQRQQFKKAYDDSIKLLYELRNKITRSQGEAT